MKKIMLGLGVFLIASVSFAALPPYYRTAGDIKVILSSNDVASKLGSGRPIESVVRNGSNYDITAGNCTVSVQVNYLAQPHIATSSEIKLHVSEANCLKPVNFP